MKTTNPGMSAKERIDWDRNRKRERVALKKVLQEAKELCRYRYCLGEALPSGLCGKHEEDEEDAPGKGAPGRPRLTNQQREESRIREANRKREYARTHPRQHTPIAEIKAKAREAAQAVRAEKQQRVA